MEDAIAQFLKNPYWKDLYDKAPALCKEFYRYHFAHSLKAVEKKVYEDAVIGLYKKFSPEDWEYLISNTQSSMGKWGYRQAREKYANTND